MPINKFKFVSPGVQVAEIDNSQLPATPAGSGPVIIGRAEKGPSLRPVTVNSFSDFVSTFGMPWGGGDSAEVWRSPVNKMSPSYGVYAAQAYLRNSSPLTFVRVLGRENPDRTVAGRAGWAIGAGGLPGNSTTNAGGGCFGLFLINSASTTNTTSQLAATQGGQTGTLAAVFYCQSGFVSLEGTGVSGTAGLTGTCGLIQTVGSDYELRARVMGSTGLLVEQINFNFDRNSQKYIRRVFNTNPTKLNSSISSVTESYFLGESYDFNVDTLTSTRGSNTAGNAYGVILAMASGTVQQNDRRRTTTPAQTGWIFSQALAASSSYSVQNMQRIFKFHSLNAGGWESANLKLAISDIAAATSDANPYGTFTVEVRKAKDNDGTPEFVERFARCNLNPNSTNYVARKVGDKFVTWNDSQGRYIEKGEYTNQSTYVRIEMNADVAAGNVNDQLIPFGFIGPPRYKNWMFQSGSGNTPLGPTGTPAGVVPASEGDAIGYTYAEASGSIIQPMNQSPLIPGGTKGGATTQDFIITDGSFITGSFSYPTLNYRRNTIDSALPGPSDAYFGLDTTRSGSSPMFEESYVDVIRAFPQDFAAQGNTEPATTAGSQTSSAGTSGPGVATIFSLDEVRFMSGAASGISSTQAEWVPGCRRFKAADNPSITAGSGSGQDWTRVLTSGFNKFAFPLFGGFDGIDIKDTAPFGYLGVGGGGVPTIVDNYAFNSVKMAIDSCADPEVVDCNIMAVPGNYEPGITNHLMKTCEKRADSLAVIDLEGGYIPSGDGVVNTSDPDMGSVTTTINTLRGRAINSSYACAYYPWVQIRDENSSKLFYAPPSIPAIGTFSSAQKQSAVWFAPAGFTRGGLTEGSAGIPVVGVAQRLSSNNRDDLYEASINPIASFPAEGIVIFGQKTLQTVPSVLDRVNVRRLMIHVKKNISFMASRLLFDQNVQVTWDRFTNQAIPFLESIKQRLGLMAYKVVLDESTTTADLIDRNIMYAKIYLKPARAIEFIAIDFVITNAGASFED